MLGNDRMGLVGVHVALPDWLLWLSLVDRRNVRRLAREDIILDVRCSDQ